jgi:hypothetical protein
VKLTIEYEVPEGTSKEQAVKLVAKKHRPLKWIEGWKLEQVGPTKFKKVGVLTITTEPK